MPPASNDTRALSADALFTAAIFVSAALLFSVQPMVAKMALPHLGGTPAVWAVSMCVFQGLLLAGYCYAHLVGTRLSLRAGSTIHIAVLVAAAATLPVTLRLAADTAPAGGYVGWLVATLVLTIGLPFFALSANAPLLQRWYARLGAGRSADPYRLYVASNAGSLLALVAYPLLVEPVFTVTSQRLAWTAGYTVLVALIALAAWRTAMHAPSIATDHPEHPATAAQHHPIRNADRLSWIALALVPSGLLVAVTTFLTTDLASAPLVWVVPLALYLVTYILVFRERAAISSATSLRLALATTVAMLTAVEWNNAWSWIAGAMCAVSAVFATSLVCHRLLYERRPHAERLTEFYFFTSLGGVLGGISAALIAPLIVTEILELPLLLAAGLALGVAGTAVSAAKPARNTLLITTIVAAAVPLVLLAVSRFSAANGVDVRFWSAICLAAATVLTLARPRIAAVPALLLVAATIALPQRQPPIHTARSFFGTHRVLSVAGGRVHTLLHGTTVHGAEIRTDAEGRPIERPPPIAYYHQSGPIAGSVQMARLLSGSPRNPLKAAVIGLGAGAIACHAMPGDAWTFFELDPDVVRIASDPRYFRYLTACQPDARIVIGDARQTVSREPAAGFDYLLLDAFSSDAIPTHLLTREALAMFLEKLVPGGILALHVSNQNLDLVPSLEATLATLPAITAIYAEGTRSNVALPSQVVIVSRDDRIASSLTTWANMRRLGTGSTARPWTDDYSDIVRPMLRKFGRKIASDVQ